MPGEISLSEDFVSLYDLVVISKFSAKRGRNFMARFFYLFGKRWAWERPFNFRSPRPNIYIYTWKLKTNMLLPDFSCRQKEAIKSKVAPVDLKIKGPHPLVFELKLSHFV